jgi:hypothetical protein
MATPDVSKESIYDPRIVQTPARYAVAKGGVSVTNANFLAVSQTTSQHTYNINSPSLQTFIDRAIFWTSSVYIQFVVAVNTPQPVAGTQEPIVVIGRDIALCAFPLHQLVGTLTAQINDTTVSINTDTVLKEVLRLTDYKANRLVRTCPTMLDKYASYDEAYLAVNNPLASYLDGTEEAEQPNGAYWDIGFTNPAGTELSSLPSGTYLNTIGGGGNVQFINTPQLRGIPIRTAGPGAENGPYAIYLRFTSKERLVLSPFIFADANEYSTGLFSVNNIQLVMNMSQVGVSRVIRSSSGGGRVISTTSAGQVQYNTSAPNGGFNNSQVSLLFISPNLDLPLPSKSVVPYTDFPRFITTNLASIPAGQSASQINSQTVTLPSIPDLLVFYAKPSSYADTTVADWYMPITQISLNFNNFAGLLSNHTPEELYTLSVANGLEMNYNEWIGSSWTARRGSTVHTVGGFLVVKPGKDFALQTGEAPGLQGQITVQYTVTIRNPSTSTAYSPILYLMTVQSGFFETLAGSSRVVKNILSEADVINAPMAPEASSTPLTRIVGGSFWSSLGSMLSKAQQAYTATKPAISAVKGLLPDGTVKSGLSAVGYGMTGGAPAGAGRTGGKKKLMDRLM